MRVPVRADLMAGLDNHACLLRERLQRMTRNEPRSFEMVLVKKLQETGNSDFTRKQATRDVVGRVFPTIRPEPSPYSININAISNFDIFRAHNCDSLLFPENLHLTSVMVKRPTKLLLHS